MQEPAELADRFCWLSSSVSSVKSVVATPSILSFLGALKNRKTAKKKQADRVSLTPEDALKKMLGVPAEKAPEDMVPRAKPKPEKGK